MGVDIRGELEQYDWGHRATWSNTKLIAESPFRYDTRPSFYVYLEDTETAPAGSWGDSGGVDDEFSKGGFVKLLAFLRNEDEESTAEYLVEQYGGVDQDDYGYDESVTIDLSGLTDKPKRPPLDPAMLEQYAYRHPYLERRGISEKVQRIMRVVYDRDRQAIVLPWYHADGRLATVLYRKTEGKAFWYEKGGVPLRELVYGLNVVYKYRRNTAVLTEAPIDALSCMTAGYAGLATGGASISRKQAELIAKSPVARLIIAGDNDRAGAEFTRKVMAAFGDYSGYIEVVSVDWTQFSEYKDVNDVLRTRGAEGCRRLFENIPKNFGIGVAIANIM